MEKVYKDIRTNGNEWLEANLYNIRFFKSSFVFRLIMASSCGCLGFLLYRPCLFFMKCYKEINTERMKKYYRRYSLFEKFLFFINFITPLFFVFSFYIHSLDHYQLFIFQVIMLILVNVMRLFYVRPLIQCYFFSSLHQISNEKDLGVIHDHLIENLKIVNIPILKLISIPFLLLTISFLLIIKGYFGYYHSILNLILLFYSFWISLLTFTFNLIGVYKFN